MLLVWRITDGKAGHDRQTAGLAKALCRDGRATVENWDITQQPLRWHHYLARRLPFNDNPSPHLIVAAGRRCQAPLLFARTLLGSKTVYLMRPQWPASWFDLCLIPKHDGALNTNRIIVTEGMMNDIPAGCARGNEGLVALGGPSKHHAWDSNNIVTQIKRVIGAQPGKSWTITTSRRTPAATAEAIAMLAERNVTIAPFSQTDETWLPQHFANVDTIWTTSDSVSMIYESLTAGAAIGIFDVPVKRDDRITRIAGDLAERGIVTLYSETDPVARNPQKTILDESTRCAALVVDRLGLNTVWRG